MPNHFDILICGAGMVGTSLALALSNSSLRIALIEAAPIKTEIENDIDGRSIALTFGSAQILKSINTWNDIQSLATAIDTVHVSAQKHFGAVRIHARDENVPALGYVVPANHLGVELNKKLLHISSENKITLLNPAKVEGLNKNTEGWEINLHSAQEKKTIQAKLIIAADGTHSTIRKLLNIATQEKDYQQSAIATKVILNRPHKNIAYERFIKEGAIALLPLKDNQAAFIWTASNQKINELMLLNDSEFLHEAQLSFGYRAGRFLTVGKRHVYPLKMLFADEQVKEGLVLIGNAAHTLHPIAAQGFNLGLSDVKKLSEIILNVHQMQQDFSRLEIVKKYCNDQIKKQNSIMKFTDRLTQIFTHDFVPLNFARTSGLLMLDVFSPLKHRLAKKLMGV